MAITLPSCSVAQQGLVTRKQLLDDGLSVAGLGRAVSRGELVRVARAVYSRESLPALPRQLVTDGRPSAELLLHARVAVLSLGDGARLCGPSAAMVQGWSLLAEPRRVTCEVAHARSNACLPAARVVRSRRSGAWLASSGGLAALPVTSAVDTAIACLIELPGAEAIAAVDSALRLENVTLADLRKAAQGQTGVRDVGRVHRLLPMLDPASGSVLESAMRYHLLTHGIDGFVTQKVLRSRSRYLLRADFCFEAVGLVVETDGSRWHQDRAGDQRKDNALAAAGWRVLRYPWVEVMHELPRVLAEIREALDTPWLRP